MEKNKKVVPLDSFSEVHKVLFWAGYSNINKRAKTWKKILYGIYRRLAIIIVIVYYVQLLLYTVESYGCFDIEKMSESLTIEILHTNMVVKSISLFFLDRRLQKLNDFLKDGIFCAPDEADQKILQKNAKKMHRLFLIMNINTSLASLFWGFYTIIKRYVNGKYEVVAMYIPYRTDTTFRFFLLFLNQIGPMPWIGNGHTLIDLLIATYYAQAQTQLKIIRQQLNNLVDETQNDRDNLTDEFQYNKDLTDKSIKERFISIVKRYKTLMWYVKEVDSIFNIPISFQFLSSSVAVCFVVYCMTIASNSFQFIFMIFLFLFVTTQIFLFSIFGNLVFVESQSLNDSLYKSDWLSLSPSFRRLLLVAMVTWSRPLEPTVCGILRLSLSTFLSIIKASYTLYTVLIVVTKNEV